MEVGFQVVHLGAEDYDAIVALWQAAGLPYKPTGRDSRAQFATQMASGLQQAIGVRAGEQLVGVVLVTHDSRKGWINRLAVHPDFRRRGVARLLIAEAERVLRDEGLQIFAALAEGWNEASLAFFAAAGYSAHPDIRYFTKRDDAGV